VKPHEGKEYIMEKGTIRRLMDLGYGFIKAEQGEDLFFHSNDVKGVAFNSLSEGQEVEFNIREGSRIADNILVQPVEPNKGEGNILVQPVEPNKGEGNILVQPVEPNKGKEDIMEKGTIRRLMDRGYGFIKSEQGEDLFFHSNDVEGAEFNSLSEGQEVEFEKGQGRDGRSAAVKVRLIETSGETQVDDSDDGKDSDDGDDAGGDVE
jgi:CspA family cold shock protein